MAASISGGAQVKPTRQPVMANALLNPPRSTVRSFIPGKEAIDVCLPP